MGAVSWPVVSGVLSSMKKSVPSGRMFLNAFSCGSPDGAFSSTSESDDPGPQESATLFIARPAPDITPPPNAPHPADSRARWALPSSSCSKRTSLIRDDAASSAASSATSDAAWPSAEPPAFWIQPCMTCLPPLPAAARPRLAMPPMARPEPPTRVPAMSIAPWRPDAARWLVSSSSPSVRASRSASWMLRPVQAS